MAQVDYYFTLNSPWAYIGHDAFHAAMERTGTTVNYLPLNVAQAFEASNTPMLGQRHKTRQAYRTLELQRWSVKRGLEFNYWPDHWPLPTVAGDKMIVSLVQNGQNPAAFMRELFTGIWERQVNYGEDSALVASAEAAGLDGSALLEQSKRDDIGAVYDKTTAEAIDLGVFGVPAYFYDGEYFWGQDRIELLEDALKSGRSGYKPVFPEA